MIPMADGGGLAMLTASSVAHLIMDRRTVVTDTSSIVIAET